MRDLDSAWRLFDKVNKDIKALCNMMDEEAFSEEIFGFHVQQSIEKLLKAWLAVIGVIYPKTHDINLLLKILEKANQDISSYEDFVEFNIYAVQLRYENEGLMEQPLDRYQCLLDVENLFNHVKKLLNDLNSGD